MKGSGLLIFVIVVLVLAAIGGNIGLLLLLFGKPLPENQGFLIFIAIVADIALICRLIDRISKKANEAIEEKERKRIDSIESRIRIIKSEFTPKKLPFLSQQSKTKIKFDNSYVNTEINRCVKEYKESLRILVKNCLIIDNKITSLLSYQSTPEEKLGYITDRMDELKNLKKESDSLHSEIEHKQIILLNEDYRAIDHIRQAFFKLKESEKCTSNSTSIRELVSDNNPFELNMFKYKYAPLVLSHHLHDYCFFGNVILVFDNKGIYVTALDPTILRLSVERKTEYVYKSTNHTQNGINTGNDSCIVHKGDTKQTWTYTRKDGYADLRYTYNPMIEYHTDEVMYGVVEFYLTGKINYTFSSYQAIVAMEAAAEKYVKKHNNMRDTVPDFLKLMRRLDPQSSVLDDISKRYKSKSKTYFCQVIQ